MLCYVMEFGCKSVYCIRTCKCWNLKVEYNFERSVNEIWKWWIANSTSITFTARFHYLCSNNCKFHLVCLLSNSITCKFSVPFLCQLVFYPPGKLSQCLCHDDRTVNIVRVWVLQCYWWWSGVVVSALASINEVNLRRARLVLKWVTVSGFNTRCRTFISVCNQPATQGQLSLPSLRGR